MAVSRRLRFEILARDGHTCRYCGAAAPDVKLTVDHVIPVTLGGGDEPNNLVTACADCNAGKSSRKPDAEIVEDVDAAAFLFAKALERAAELRGAQRADLDESLRIFDHQWENWGNWDEAPTRPGDWPATVERFLNNGLTLDVLFVCIEGAMASRAVPWNKVWNSFCRRAWDEVKAQQELARRLIEDGEV